MARTTISTLVVIVAVFAFANAGARRRSEDDWRMEDLRLRSHARREADSAADVIAATFDGLKKDEETKQTPETQRQNNEQKLFGDLIYGSGYSDNVAPADVKVHFGLAIISVQYDNTIGTAVTNVWERMMWNDARLAWSPDEYSGITTLRLPSYYIWTPDMTLYNSLAVDGYRSYRANVVVDHTGLVMWIPPARYETYCTSRDNQVSCNYKVGSWAYHGFLVGLGKFEDDDEDRWALEDFNYACGAVPISYEAKINVTTYPCCEEPYPSFEANFVFTPRGWSQN